MTNPQKVIVTGYATREEALAQWANIVDNDKLAIVEVVIGFGTFTPAKEPVVYLIMPRKNF